MNIDRLKKESQNLNSSLKKLDQDLKNKVIKNVNENALKTVSVLLKQARELENSVKSKDFNKTKKIANNIVSILFRKKSEINGESVQGFSDLKIDSKQVGKIKISTDTIESLF